eukprot:scpid108715/ scgid16127/ 
MQHCITLGIMPHVCRQSPISKAYKRPSISQWAPLSCKQQLRGEGRRKPGTDVAGKHSSRVEYAYSTFVKNGFCAVAMSDCHATVEIYGFFLDIMVTDSVHRPIILVNRLQCTG